MAATAVRREKKSERSQDQKKGNIPTSGVSRIFRALGPIPSETKLKTRQLWAIRKPIGPRIFLIKFLSYCHNSEILEIVALLTMNRDFPEFATKNKRFGARRIRCRTIRRGLFVADNSSRGQFVARLFVAGQLVAWRIRRRTIRRNWVSQSHRVCNYWVESKTSVIVSEKEREWEREVNTLMRT